MLVLKQKVEVISGATGNSSVLNNVNSIKVNKHFTTFEDTAQISVLNVQREIIQSKDALTYQEGDRITIDAGYDGVMNREFEGYIFRVERGINTMLRLQDSMYLTRRRIGAIFYLSEETDEATDISGSEREVFKPIFFTGGEDAAPATFKDTEGIEVGGKVAKKLTLRVVLETIIFRLNQVYERLEKEINFSLSVSKGVKFGKIADYITDDTTSAYLSLKQIALDFGLYIYVRGSKIIVQNQFESDEEVSTAPVVYNFKQNVQAESLRVRRKKVIIVNGRYDNTEGEAVSFTYPKDLIIDSIDGLVEEINVSLPHRLDRNQSDAKIEETLTEIAKNKIDRLTYEGLEGYLTAWLLPYVTYGQHAKIVDSKRAALNGTYLVEATSMSVDQYGGSRKVFLRTRL